jgi:hypothetical protein
VRGFSWPRWTTEPPPSVLPGLPPVGSRRAVVVGTRRRRAAVSGIALDRGGIQAACASPDDSHAHGVGVIVLAAAAGRQHPHPGQQDSQGRRRHPSRRCVAAPSGCTQAGRTFDRPCRAGPPTGEAAQRTIAGAAVQDALCGSFAIPHGQGSSTSLTSNFSPRLDSGLESEKGKPLRAGVIREIDCVRTFYVRACIRAPRSCGGLVRRCDQVDALRRSAGYVRLRKAVRRVHHSATSTPRRLGSSTTAMDAGALKPVAAQLRSAESALPTVVSSGTARSTSWSVMRPAGPETEMASRDCVSGIATATHRTPVSCSPSSIA